GRLAGDAQDRLRVRGRGVETGDHIRAGGSGGADADSDVLGSGPGVAIGHVRGPLDMAGQGVADPAVGPHRRVQRVDRRSRQTEGLGGAFLLEDEHHCVDSAHTCHCSSFFRQATALSPRMLVAGRDRRCRWAAGPAVDRRTAVVQPRSLPERCSTTVNRPEWSRPPLPCWTVEATSWATVEPSGIATPASRAAAVTMPMSLWCSCRRNPGSKERSSIFCPFWSRTLEPASPPPSTWSAEVVSTP